MDPNKHGWQAFIGQRPPNYIEPETIAKVTVTVHGVEKGKSQVQVYISPIGALAEGAGRSEKRAGAYAQLSTILEGELKDAFDILGQG